MNEGNLGSRSAQLQRIANAKHRQTVRDVIKDTVDLFGVNFQVTMESVFTTLEQTSRMIETTGENRDFKRSDLDQKKQRLICKPLPRASKSHSVQVASGPAQNAITTESWLTL